MVELSLGRVAADNPNAHGHYSELGGYRDDALQGREEKKSFEDRSATGNRKKTVSISYSQDIMKEELRKKTVRNGSIDQDEQSHAFDSLSDLSNSVRHAIDTRDVFGNNKREKNHSIEKAKNSRKKGAKKSLDARKNKRNSNTRSSKNGKSEYDLDEESQQHSTKSKSSKERSKTPLANSTVKSNHSGSTSVRSNKKGKKKAVAASLWEASVAADDISSVAGQSCENLLYSNHSTKMSSSNASFLSLDSFRDDDSRSKTTSASMNFRLRKEQREMKLRQNLNGTVNSRFNISSFQSVSTEGSDFLDEAQKPNRVELRKDLQAQVQARLESPSDLDNSFAQVVRKSIHKSIRRMSSLKEADTDVEDEKQTEDNLEEGGEASCDDDQEEVDGDGGNRDDREKLRDKMSERIFTRRGYIIAIAILIGIVFMANIILIIFLVNK